MTTADDLAVPTLLIDFILLASLSMGRCREVTQALLCMLWTGSLMRWQGS